MRVAFGSALQCELDAVPAGSRESGETAFSNENREVVRFVTGVGLFQAYREVTRVIEIYAPDYLVFVGGAGSTGPRCKVGDVVICDEVLGHDGARIRSSRVLIDVARECFEGVSSVHLGLVFSAHQFVGTECVRSVVASTGAICVETEGVSVALACVNAGVPWLLLRVITDEANKDEKPSSKSIRSLLSSIEIPMQRLLNRLLELESNGAHAKC
jgi:nucleoside phosphorylase